jgi:hypothetical protein
MMLELLEKQERLTVNQWKVVSPAILGGALGSLAFLLPSFALGVSSLIASVEIDIDGVQIGVHGIRAMREDGGTAIELPKFRDAGGVWRAAITLPEEVHSPIAKAVFDELFERGLAVRRLGAMTAVCPSPG